MKRDLELRFSPLSQSSLTVLIDAITSVSSDRVVRILFRIVSRICADDPIHEIVVYRVRIRA